MAANNDYNIEGETNLLPAAILKRSGVRHKLDTSYKKIKLA